ncbi:hypothetical protein RM530_04020 [Algiphilus sp. W345]|uniref:Uncharacterized protein n=1 Tax=Banduia mediterranea TaxID=3075609 RepID=A0ABU2WF83_9GAMM|nr:hypothetical protein [Algiphilus sp. W345]MDT0496532.1 hypothetical protein [Algiphilus sp. W345]
MGVQYYSSEDAGAPVLSGQAGALTALLDACVVDGYGSKPALGWEIAFTGTDLRAYRSTDPDASGALLRVQDTGTTVAMLRGFLTMSDIDTGTFSFPTSAQAASGLYAHKSNSATSDSRAWYLVGDERAFLLATNAYSSYWSVHFFGDVIGYSPTDAAAAILLADTSNSATGYAGFDAGGMTTGSPRSRWARGIDEMTESPLLGCSVISANNQSIGYGGYCCEYPNVVDGSIGVAPIILREVVSGGAILRGQLPGIFQPLHNHGLEFGALIPGNGDLTGRNLVVVLNGASSSAIGNVIVDVTGPWR